MKGGVKGEDILSLLRVRDASKAMNLATGKITRGEAEKTRGDTPMSVKDAWV